MKRPIADSELPMMQALWKRSPQTSPELLAQIGGNPSTQKTLLKRLVDKGLVEAEPITSRSFRYSPTVTQEDYQKDSSRHFLDKVFQGSGQAMLLNFVQDDKVTVDDLQELLDLLKETYSSNTEPPLQSAVWR